MTAISGLSAALFLDEDRPYVVTDELCFAAKASGNKIKIVVSGNETPLSVGAVGKVATINAETDNQGNAISTAGEIITAFQADNNCDDLFDIRLPPGVSPTVVPGALAETEAADGVEETGLVLTDSGDGLKFQAGAGYRYWDDRYSLSVYIDGSLTATGFVVNFLRGQVTFDADSAGKTITVYCTRRSELAFQKVWGLFDGIVRIKATTIDTTSVDDDVWGSSIVGARSWELSAGVFYYDGNLPITMLSEIYLWKFYSVLSTKTSYAIGKGSITDIDITVAAATEAQKQSVTVKGVGELYIE